MALACIPDTGAGCTSDRGLPRPSGSAFKAVSVAWPGPAASIRPSKAGGPTEFPLWSSDDRAMSDETSKSSTPDEPGAFLAFLWSGSLGSSWQRWPILRFMHRVHGRSCSVGPCLRVSQIPRHQREAQGRRGRTEPRPASGNEPSRRILHTRSHVICCSQTRRNNQHNEAHQRKRAARDVFIYLLL